MMRTSRYNLKICFVMRVKNKLDKKNEKCTQLPFPLFNIDNQTNC